MNLVRRTFAKLSTGFFFFFPSSLVRDFHLVCSFIEGANRAYISDVFLDTLILAEDRRFLFHVGVDPIAIVRAIWVFLIKGKLQGASTIEQQLVRTITQRYEFSIIRKLREMVISILVSSIFSKEQIAKAYLSTAYFGWQMNGICQACSRLSIQVDNATLSEAAEIISRLKYPQPEVASPIRFQQIRIRATHILHLHRKVSIVKPRFGFQIDPYGRSE